MAKELWVGTAYLATGVLLIIGSLVMLGLIIDAIMNSYYMADGQVPTLVAWFPLFFVLISVGWGGYFIWKSTNTLAPSIAFYLIGKAGYKVLSLHRLSIRRRKAIAALIILVSLVVVFIEIIPAGIKVFGDPVLLEIEHPNIALIGVVAIIVSMAIGSYDPDAIPHKG